MNIKIGNKDENSVLCLSKDFVYENEEDYYSCTAINNNGVYIVSEPIIDRLPKISGERIVEAVKSTKKYKKTIED